MTKSKTVLSIEEVKHIARLALLDLTNEELAKYQKQLSQVIDYINQLKKLDTAKVIPTSQVTNLENVFREDRITPSLSQKETLSNAKNSYKGYFKVKAIFEE